MDKLIVTLETIECLIGEKQEALKSEHYSIRYSAEGSLRALKDVKQMVEEKISMLGSETFEGICPRCSNKTDMVNLRDEWVCGIC